MEEDEYKNILSMIGKLEKNTRFNLYRSIMKNIINDVSCFELACQFTLIEFEQKSKNSFEVDTKFYKKSIEQIGNILFLRKMINGFGVDEGILNEYINSLYSNNKEKGELNVDRLVRKIEEMQNNRKS